MFGVPFLKLVSDCTLCALFLVFIQKGSLLIIAIYYMLLVSVLSVCLP
jgi:hypothetical protein